MTLRDTVPFVFKGLLYVINESLYGHIVMAL